MNLNGWISWYLSLCWLMVSNVKLGSSKLKDVTTSSLYQRKKIANTINHYKRREDADSVKENNRLGVKKTESKDVIPIAYQIPKCEPRSTIIPIDKSSTSEGYTLFPHCIMADRCGGCCREEKMDCVVDELKTKSVYVYKVAKGFTADKITSLQKVNYINHEACRCKHKLYINQ